jgi:tetratricopeptide (TPR) repeat protein
VAAAEAVTGASLKTLDSLVSKQLLVRRGDRLHMLQTVREYAIERLDADPTRREWERRLEGWWLQLAREANPHLVRADRGPWLARLDDELPNALAALTRALERGEAEVALELAAELGHYWWRTHGSEHGVSWLEEAVERGGDGSIPARATAHLYRARLRTPRRYEAHREDLHASLDLFRACDHAAGIAACLSHLAVAEAMFGESRLAPDLRDEALRYARRSGDEETLGLALADMALSATSYEEAAGQAPAAVEYLSRTGNLLDLVIVCSVTGYYGLADGRYREGLEWLDQALDAADQLGNRRSVFFIRGNQGLARLFLDELDEAASAFHDSIAAARDVAAEDLVDEALLGMAAVAARREEADRAACLAGAARAHGGPGRNRAEETVVSRMKEDILLPARDRFGRDTWDRAEQQGASLTVQQAIELALIPAGEPRSGHIGVG